MENKAYYGVIINAFVHLFRYKINLYINNTVLGIANNC